MRKIVLNGGTHHGETASVPHGSQVVFPQSGETYAPMAPPRRLGDYEVWSVKQITVAASEN